MPLSEGCCLVSREEQKAPDGSRGIVFPGPMRGVLPLLEGRCLSLTSLFLRKAGQMYRSNKRTRYWSAAADEEVYSEWAAFIESVRPTLEVLVIEQGTSSMVQRRNHVSGPGVQWISVSHDWWFPPWQAAVGLFCEGWSFEAPV